MESGPSSSPESELPPSGQQPERRESAQSAPSLELGSDEAFAATTTSLNPTRLDYLQTLHLVETNLLQFEDPPLEVEGRVSAAMTLAERGEVGSAMDLLREALVLTKTMTELKDQGRRHDLLDLKIEAHLRKRLGELLDGDQLKADMKVQAQRISEQVVAESLGDDPFREAVGRLVEGRLVAYLEEQAFEQAVERLLSHELERFLAGGPFARASAAATARFPEELLARPETVSRVEALAVEADDALVASSKLGERVRELVDREVAAFVHDARFEARVNHLHERRLDEWLATPQATEALQKHLGEGGAKAAEVSQAIETATDQLLEREAFLAKVDERARALIETPAFGAQIERSLRDSVGVGRALEDRLRDSSSFDELLAQRSRKLLGRPEFSHRVDQMIRERCKALLSSSPFERAVDERAREQAGDQVAELGRQLETRQHAAARAAADGLLESPAFRELVSEASLESIRGERKKIEGGILETVAGMVNQAVARGLDARLAKAMPPLLSSSLAEGGELRQELDTIVEDAIRRGVDDKKVIRLVQNEVANREALRNAAMSGDGLVDQATAIARSEAISKVIDEHLRTFKNRELAKQRERKSGAQARPEAGEDSAPKTAKKTTRKKKKKKKT